MYTIASPSGAGPAGGLSAIKGAWKTSQATRCLTLPEIRLSEVPNASTDNINRPLDKDRSSAAETGVETSRIFSS